MLSFYCLLQIFILCICVFGKTRDTTSTDIDNQIADIKKSLKYFQLDSSKSKDYALLWYQLGVLLQTKDVHYNSGGLKKEENLIAFDNAIKHIADGDIKVKADALYRKGLLLKMMGRSMDSLACYDELLSKVVHKFDISSIYVSKADVFMMIGDIDSAISLYERAIEYAPWKLSNYYPLISAYQEKNVKSTREWYDFLSVMKEVKDNAINGTLFNPKIMNYESSLPLFDSNSLSSEIKSDFYWSLYICANKAQEHQLAWQFLQTAHELELNSRVSILNNDELINLNKNIKSIFNANSFIEGLGHSSKVPVFIVGMMRSGSTLLETMLNAHKDMWGIGEESIFNGNLNSFRNDLVKAIDSGDINKLRDSINKHGKFVEKNMLTKAEDQYLDAYNSSAPKFLHVIDKMLFNYRNIGFIRMMFPNALIIHTIRDPMDTLLSCFKHKFDNRGLEWAFDMEALILNYVLYLDIMDHFRNLLGPTFIIDVRYEELVINPRKVMQMIIKRLNLKWDENVLDYHKLNRTVHTHSQSQVRYNIYTESIGSWKRYAKQLKDMIKLLKKELKKLNPTALIFRNEMNWDFDVDFDYKVDDNQNTMNGENEKARLREISYNINGIIDAKKGDTIVIDSNGDIGITS